MLDHPAEPSACAGCRGGEAFEIPFTMALQPIVDLRARRISGYEALVRGVGGEPAGSVLARVTAQNRYAFDQACRVKAIALAAELGLKQRLSINFMPNAVYNPKACIRATLDEAMRVKFPLDQITFEITEDERITDSNHLRAIIGEYRSHGFRVALDDFGAGYSGLLSLAALDVDLIKLDIGLIRGIDTDVRSEAIVRGIVRVCGDLGVSVVAEGVERMDELHVLEDAGVDYAQGYLFARPVVGRLVGDGEIPALAS